MLVGEVFARMGLDSRQYEKGLDSLEGYTKKRALTLGGIFKGAFSFALGIGVIQGFRSLGGAITDFVNTAARTEVLDIAMQSVARSSGYAIAALNEQRKAVMELGIAEQEASQILTRFMQAQLDTADAAKLARVAQDAAVIAGYNSSQAAEQMTEAIAKQRPELLSAFGMTRNMNDIYKDYAATVGKAAGKLTEAERKQAMLNYILAEGEKIAGTYERSMGSAFKKLGSLTRYVDTFKNAIAAPLALPAFGVIVDAITDAFKRGIAWAEANKATLVSWGQTVANAVTFALRYVGAFAKFVMDNWPKITFVIRTAAIAFLSYYSVIGVLNAVTLATKLLTGTLVTNSIVLGFLNNFIIYYRVLMLEAGVATNFFSGTLTVLRSAAQAAWTALGPLGWIILIISAAVAGGIALWNKYNASLRKTAQSASQADMMKKWRELEAQQKAATKTALDAAGGQGKLGDALKKAAKAAGKSLQSFDEVHTLQQDMGGLDDMPDLDMPGLDLDIPDIGFEIPDMGDLLGGFGDGLDMELPPLKERIKGFFKWIWDEAKAFMEGKWGPVVMLGINPVLGLLMLLDRNKEKILKFFSDVKDGAKAKWGELQVWAAGFWDGVQAKWGEFIDRVSSLPEAIGQFVSDAGGWLSKFFTEDLPYWVGYAIGSLLMFFIDLPGNIWKYLTIAAAKIGEWAGLVIDWAKRTGSNFLISFTDFIKQLPGKVWTWLVETANKIPGWGNELLTRAKIAAGKLVSGFVGVIQQLPGLVWNTLLDVANSLLRIGGALWDNAKKIASNLWEGFKAGLGIASPSYIEEAMFAIEDTSKQMVKGLQRDFGTLSRLKMPTQLFNAVGADITVGKAGQSSGRTAAGPGGFATDIADSVAQAVYSAIRDAIRVSRIEQGGGSQGRERQQEIVLEIDGTRIGRAILPALISESQRLGGGSIIQLQGG